jgi:hypothetical protein
MNIISLNKIFCFSDYIKRAFCVPVALPRSHLLTNLNYYVELNLVTALAFRCKNYTFSSSKQAHDTSVKILIKL